MTPAEANELLEKLQAGVIESADVIRAFQAEPIADLGFAQVDRQRELRCGFPEVIFGTGKTAEQIAEIGLSILDKADQLLVTRVEPTAAAFVCKRLPDAVHHESARCITVEKEPLPKRAGTIAVLSAGTSDMPVAEEAAVTAEIMGNHVKRIYDVGIAGLHRLLARADELRKAHVIVAVAGMEGALPSAVAGLVDKPVIAVPTSIGYGANLGGIAALLGMLNSCGSGVTVVNIDNGFGAAYAASQINALANHG